jgi:hypothetical protein
VVSGRKPKPVHRHSVQPAYDWIDVEDREFSGAPELPSDRKWSAATRDWWTAISTMPHCVLWRRSDWRFAIETAYVCEVFHAGDMRQAQELRRREAIMGTTPGARLGLRIRYVEPEEVEETRSVAALIDYRKRLGVDGA